MPSLKSPVQPLTPARALALQAFTLIELSIVLVIIGLILAGVLTGRDLIYASRIRKMGTELQQISVAINTFRVSYDCLPGDCPNATTFFGANSSACPSGGGTTGVCNGNGDGFISGYGGSVDGNVEHLYAWQELALANLIPWRFKPNLIRGGSPAWQLLVGENIPASAFNERIGYNFYSVRTGLALAGKKTLEIGAPGDPYYDVLSGAGLTAPQASSLDLKFDDGNPQSGKIYAASGGSSISTHNSIATQSSPVNSNTTCVASGAYLTSPSSGCTMEYTPDVP